ncbi:MAG TPA: helix-turn-helix transcriptional regulator [Candidatus Acidoferrales bacterium]
MAKKRAKAGYMISAVAELYKIHPQTLRLYEREGLLKPSRSQGNTRLYSDRDLERLEVILNLSRDLGVNLAGIEIVLNMREHMAEMQREMEQFVEFIKRELTQMHGRAAEERFRNALVRVGPPKVIRIEEAESRQGEAKSEKGKKKSAER